MYNIYRLFICFSNCTLSSFLRYLFARTKLANSSAKVVSYIEFLLSSRNTRGFSGIVLLFWNNGLIFLISELLLYLTSTDNSVAYDSINRNRRENPSF